MTQVTPITSEALQATIRRLLPSQVGFGEDLEAINLIQPVVDITPTAEGTQLRQDLQTAIDRTITVTSTANTTNTIFSGVGFIQVDCRFQNNSSGAVLSGLLQIENSLGTKTVYEVAAGTQDAYIVNDLVFFVGVGETLKAQSTAADAILKTYARQIADLNGNLVNPSGFNPQ